MLYISAYKAGKVSLFRFIWNHARTSQCFSPETHVYVAQTHQDVQKNYKLNRSEEGVTVQNIEEELDSMKTKTAVVNKNIELDTTKYLSYLSSHRCFVKQQTTSNVP